jgi:serine/threonine-protein kinase
MARANDVDSATGQPESIPRRVGPYVVFEKIGEGGMAEIFLAQKRLGIGHTQRVVLKRLHPHLAEVGDLVQSLIDEAKVAAHLRSGNVAQVLDLTQHGDSLYIAMEYIEGLDLNHLLQLFTKHQLRVPLSFVFHVVTGMLNGVDAVHNVRDESGKKLGLVHLDITPGNILVSFEGEVKLCDFGIARATARGILDRSRGKIQGKFSYMSPEQASGLELDHRSDLFTCGIVLWELLAGRKMYKSKERSEIYRMAREAEVPQLPDRGLPDYEGLHRILSKSLRKEPGHRYDSAKDFNEAVTDYVHRHNIRLSQIEVGRFLSEHFAEDILQVRRERERLIDSLALIEEDAV